MCGRSDKTRKRLTMSDRDRPTVCADPISGFSSRGSSRLFPRCALSYIKLLRAAHLSVREIRVRKREGGRRRKEKHSCYKSDRYPMRRSSAGSLMRTIKNITAKMLIAWRNRSLYLDRSNVALGYVSFVKRSHNVMKNSMNHLLMYCVGRKENSLY